MEQSHIVLSVAGPVVFSIAHLDPFGCFFHVRTWDTAGNRALPCLAAPGEQRGGPRVSLEDPAFARVVVHRLPRRCMLQVRRVWGAGRVSGRTAYQPEQQRTG